MVAGDSISGIGSLQDEARRPTQINDNRYSVHSFAQHRRLKGDLAAYRHDKHDAALSLPRLLIAVDADNGGERLAGRIQLHD